jgi:hypothetical protein
MYIGEQLRYDPGNLGDILKHSWLIAVIEWLFDVEKKECLSYADSFCGCYEYHSIKKYIIDRFLLNFKNSRLFCLQENSLKAETYLGSSAIVNNICSKLGKDVTISIFDNDKSKIDTFKGTNIIKFELSNGYDIIDDKNDYDLILLDPYADFIPNYRKYLPRLVKKSINSSILLFILNLTNSTRQYNKVITRLKECLGCNQNAIIGRIPAHPFNEAESKYHFEILFLPKIILSKTALEELFPRLHMLTLDLNRCIQKEMFINYFQGMKE